MRMISSFFYCKSNIIYLFYHPKKFVPNIYSEISLQTEYKKNLLIMISSLLFVLSFCSSSLYFSNQIRHTSRLSLDEINHLINRPIQSQITSEQEKKEKKTRWGENDCLLPSLISFRMNAFIWLVVSRRRHKLPCTSNHKTRERSKSERREKKRRKK